MPAEETVNASGQSYVAPWDYVNLTPEQQQDHWTLTATDVIEFKTNEIAGNVKKYFDNEEKKFQARAQKRNLQPGAAPSKPAATPPNPTPEPSAPARKTNAPGMGSEVIPTAKKDGAGAAPKKGKELLKEMWGIG